MEATTETVSKAPAKPILSIKINPRTVQHYARPPKTLLYEKTINLLGRPRRFRYLLNPLRFFSKPLLQGGKWDRNASPVEGGSAYQRIADLFGHRENYKASTTYREAARMVLNGTPFQHKKFLIFSIHELDRFFEDYLMDLIDSMDRFGYLESKGTAPCYVMLSRDGRLIKGRKGRHRFAAARVTGAPFIPVQISHIHKDFAKRYELARGRTIDWDRMATVIGNVEADHQ